MTGRTPEIHRDYFEECLKHFARAFNEKFPSGTPGVSNKRRPMAEFCKTSELAIRGYISGEYKPVGELSLRVTCYLDMSGYRIIEFERLPEVAKRFVELIGYGIITANEGASIANYKRPADLFRVLRGDVGLGSGKEEAMLNAFKEKQSMLEQRKKEALSLCIDLSIPKHQTQIIPFDEDRVMAEVKKSISRPSGMTNATLSLMKGLLYLFEEGILEVLSPKEIEGLKEKHASTILKLSAHMSTLSSKIMSTGE